MKKLIPLSLTLCLLLAGISSSAQAQTAENPWGFSFRVGFSSYNGDLGNSMLELADDNAMTYGVGLTYLFNDAWGIALNANMTQLEKANGPNHMNVSQRNTSFSGNNFNTNLMLQWRFTNSFIDGRDSKFSPYLTAGVAANFLHYNSSTNKGTTIVPNDKNTTFFSIPFGAGINYAISENVSFNLQAIYNRTFTDDVDLFSSEYGNDIDGIDHDDYLMTTVGVTFNFGGDDAEEGNKKVLESLDNIERSVDDVEDQLDELIDLNQQSLDALNELQENQGMSQQQMNELRAKFVRIVNNIQFAFDESYIIEPAKDELASLATVMKEYNNLDINIEAYADERGATEYNQELASARAQSVKDFLTSRGVDGSRITTNVYGETETVYSSTKADKQTVWAQNRAVQITLSYDG